jgi:hypothetical protein
MRYVVYCCLLSVSAPAQQGFHKPDSIPARVLEHNLKLNTRPVLFKDLDRASRVYNHYFSQPENLQPKRFSDGRFATNVDIFETVNNAIDARRYPEIKW